MTATDTEVRTVDLDEAKRLLREVCEAEPDRIDTTQLYFDPTPESGNPCLCVVGGVIEKLGKGLNDLIDVDPLSTFSANGQVFEVLEVDGLEFTDDAREYLDRARVLNDLGTRWGDISARLA